MTPFVAASGSKNDSKKMPKGLIRYLSWGNVLALVTATLFAVSVYYTKAYSNYKDRVTVQSGEIASYKEQLKDIEIDRNKAVNAQEAAVKEAQKAKEKADSARGKYAALQVQLGDLRKQYEALAKSTGAKELLMNQIAENKEKLTKATNDVAIFKSDITTLKEELSAANSSIGDFKSRWEGAQRANVQLTDSITALKNENDKLLEILRSHGLAW